MTPEEAAAEACSTCHRSAAQLAAVSGAWWECSHVDCPNRKRLTAAPPRSNAFATEGDGCGRVKPVHQE